MNIAKTFFSYIEKLIVVWEPLSVVGLFAEQYKCKHSRALKLTNQLLRYFATFKCSSVVSELHIQHFSHLKVGEQFNRLLSCISYADSNITVLIYCVDFTLIIWLTSEINIEISKQQKILSGQWNRNKRANKFLSIKEGKLKWLVITITWKWTFLWVVKYDLFLLITLHVHFAKIVFRCYPWFLSIKPIKLVTNCFHKGPDNYEKWRSRTG